MIVVRTAFVAPHGRTDRPGEQFVLDLIWLCARADDQIEHVRVIDGPIGYDVVWFLLSPGEELARTTAIALSYRVISAVPSLAGWSVAA